MTQNTRKGTHSKNSGNTNQGQHGQGRRKNHRKGGFRIRPRKAILTAPGSEPKESYLPGKITLGNLSSAFYRVCKIVVTQLGSKGPIPSNTFDVIDGSYPAPNAGFNTRVGSHQLRVPAEMHERDDLGILTVMTTPAGTFWWFTDIRDIVMSSVTGTLMRVDKKNKGHNDVWFVKKDDGVMTSFEVPYMKVKGKRRYMLRSYIDVGGRVEAGGIIAGPYHTVHMNNLPSIASINPFNLRKLRENTGLDWSKTQNQMRDYRQMSLQQYHAMTADRNKDILAASQALGLCDATNMREVTQGMGDNALGLEGIKAGLLDGEGAEELMKSKRPVIPNKNKSVESIFDKPELDADGHPLREKPAHVLNGRILVS